MQQYVVRIIHTWYSYTVYHVQVIGLDLTVSRQPPNETTQQLAMVYLGLDLVLLL